MFNCTGFEQKIVLNNVMKKLLTICALLLWQTAAQAALTIEITEGIEGALPIAVVPFGLQKGVAPLEQDVAAIIKADLARSGRFKTLPVEDMLSKPTSGEGVEFRDWQVLGMDNLVVGSIRSGARGGYVVQVQLFDVFRGEQLFGFTVPTTERNLRITAHRISDRIYEKLIGEPGAFATRVAYITSQRLSKRSHKLALKIADADGYNPQTIVTSKEPLLSPSWSPDGSRIAYVSFEKKRPSIYIQEVKTGRRTKVASFEGINGAPAWSPDGQQLAMTLSKDGNPDIFVLNLKTSKLRPLTRHYAIDTEASWSPDGRHIIFTSDRGGSPQIYRVPSYGGKAKRITFENRYNARASYAPDGESIIMVTRVGGHYRIAELNLKSNILRVLTNGDLDESPSFAPNGSMVIYATNEGTKAVLSAVSIDGRVKQRLVLDEGDIREPVWSPYRR